MSEFWLITFSQDDIKERKELIERVAYFLDDGGQIQVCGAKHDGLHDMPIEDLRSMVKDTALLEAWSEEDPS